MLAKAGVLTDFPTEAGKTPQNFSQAIIREMTSRWLL
jgi:hypothetical protein